MNKLLLAVSLSIGMILSSYAADNNFTDPAKPIVVSKQHPIFTIKLPSNRTTGFMWVLVHYNDHLIEPLSAAYRAPDSKLIGAPGYEIWKFKVKTIGCVVPQVTNLKLSYARSWNLEQSRVLNFKVVCAGK